jgi:hypothetical protein
MTDYTKAMNDARKRLNAKTIGEEKPETERSVSDLSTTIVTLDGESLSARDLTPLMAVRWLESRGKTFRLSDDASQLWVEPKCDPLEAWVVKDNARQMKPMLARRREEEANREWDAGPVADLLEKATTSVKTAQAALDRAKPDDGTAEAWHVIEIHLDAMASAIRDRDRAALWRACDELVWLCGQIREWDRDPKKKPPDELFKA